MTKQEENLPSSISNRSRAPITTGPWASGKLSIEPYWESNGNVKSSSMHVLKPSIPPENQHVTQVQYNEPSKAIKHQQQKQYQQQQPPTLESFDFDNYGSATSKFAPPEVKQALEMLKMQRQQQQQKQQQQNHQLQSQSILQLDSLCSPQSTPAPTRRVSNNISRDQSEPLIVFNISINAGVTAKMYVHHPNEDPKTLVDEFEAEHKLMISDDTKNALAEKLRSEIVDCLQNQKYSRTLDTQ